MWGAPWGARLVGKLINVNSCTLAHTGTLWITADFYGESIGRAVLPLCSLPEGPQPVARIQFQSHFPFAFGESAPELALVTV